METKAQLKFLHIAPRKARLVAHVIKGMDTKRALEELRIMAKRSAKPIEKLLRSAVVNRSRESQHEEGGLVVKNVLVDSGPVYKRQMPRAFGRASLIKKRTSHITVILENTSRNSQK